MIGSDFTSDWLKKLWEFFKLVMMSDVAVVTDCNFCGLDSDSLY